VTATFLFKQREFALTEKALVATLISWWVVNCGVLFEKKAWVWVAEYARIVLFAAAGVVVTWYFSASPLYYAVSGVYLLVSLVWIISIRKHAWS
jgi:uncharacterized membrane protein